MKVFVKASIVIMSVIAAAGILHALGEGVKIGEIRQINKKSGDIMVGSPTAGSDILMGDLLYVRVEGKAVQLRSTFPMQTLARCRAEGKNRELWTKIKKGLPVYRWRSDITDEIIREESEEFKDSKEENKEENKEEVKNGTTGKTDKTVSPADLIKDRRLQRLRQRPDNIPAF